MRRRERRSEYAKGRGCASTRGKKFPRTHTRIFTFVLQTHRKSYLMKIEKRKKHPPCGRGDGNGNDVAVVYFRRNGASASAGTASAAHGASLAHARAAPPETIRRFSRREPTTRTSADRSDAARRSAPSPHFSWNPREPSALPGGRKGPSLIPAATRFPTRLREDARVAVSCAEGRGPCVSASSGASPAPTTSTELAGAVAGGGRSRRNAATARATSSSDCSSASATGPKPGDCVVLSVFVSVPNAAASAAGECPGAT